MRKNLKCKILGHKLEKVENGDLLIQEYTCTRCAQKFTTDGYGRIVKYSEYWKENHLLFQNHSIKKLSV